MSSPDVIAYCETGSEDEDNARFLIDCEKWFGKKITKISNPKYSSTWDVWETRRFLSGIKGAPCTTELKVAPRLAFQSPDDLHIFGYTSDAPDIKRAEALRENWPELNISTPLIDRGISKGACFSIIESAGICLPRVYALGFPNANCIPCCKATSPSYWALVRKEYPLQFTRMADLSRKLGAKLSRIEGKRIFIDEIPQTHETTQAIAPECDFLCGLVEQELAKETK